MKIVTMSIVAGTNACDAKCPFCVSKMTTPEEFKAVAVNWRNFELACRVAARTGVTTALITGKGEPTIHSEQLTDYLVALEAHEFPFVELQTNGIRFLEPAMKSMLRKWYHLGLTTIALSLVHYEQSFNRRVYGGEHYDLAEMVEMLHAIGYSVRLTVMLMRDAIDCVNEVKKLVEYAKSISAEQITIRNIEAPKTSDHTDPIFRWTNEHKLEFKILSEIRQWLHLEHTKVLELSFGAEVFDVEGQNLCLSNCLTINEERDTLRQLIFFPDGHLRYAWQYPGAILL